MEETKTRKEKQKILNDSLLFDKLNECFGISG